MKPYYYSASISKFLETKDEEIIGTLASQNDFNLEITSRDAWKGEINILKTELIEFKGKGEIYFEFSIPRMGRRIDVVLLIGPVVFVLEFKVGEKEYPAYAIEQVWDYALDLSNFHEPSHNKYIAPILVSTHAQSGIGLISTTIQNDFIFFPIKTNKNQISERIQSVLDYVTGENIDTKNWENGRYAPTPTIVEAALALYSGHKVSEISNKSASAKNLTKTSSKLSEVIGHSKSKSTKTICFVTGVPGAGKTLVGLNIATTHIDPKSELYSVYLSGNGPLVKILQEALTRDRVKRLKAQGKKVIKKFVYSEVKEFVQNVHNFRNYYHGKKEELPVEHVVLFDEAQRAWNLEMTCNFMRRKNNEPNFNQSEPHFLISCLDRHQDWAVIVCLVGGGQEINTGEAGIGEWIESLTKHFNDWHIYISPNLMDSEFGAGKALQLLQNRNNVYFDPDLHLSVSMRSFRAEKVSLFVKELLDLNIISAKQTLSEINKRYPIVITRDLQKAKKWLKSKASGSERYGIVVSSQAERLKPHAIDVKSPMDPVHWFLDGKEDVRSSFYLEDVATEFDIQGLELDWVCVTWDADFRYSEKGWKNYSFVGNKWNNINKVERQQYLKNAYRVLLTRARQGMVIVVPNGDLEDHTRNPEYYDPTFNYLKNIGFLEI